MNGELGVLYQSDKQVGGVSSWEVLLSQHTTASNKWQESFYGKKLKIFGYWLLDNPQGEEFDIELFKVIQGQLVLMDKGIVIANFPEDELNKKYLTNTDLSWRQPDEY